MAKVNLPSNVDLTTVETGIPLLKEGLYDVRVDSMIIKPNKANDGEILETKMVLEQSGESVTGEEVKPGFPIFHRVSLKITEKYNPARNLAALQDCFLGGRAAEFDTEEFIGKTGTVKLKIRRDEEYGDSNEVRSFEKKG